MKNLIGVILEDCSSIELNLLTLNQLISLGLERLIVVCKNDHQELINSQILTLGIEINLTIISENLNENLNLTSIIQSLCHITREDDILLVVSSNNLSSNILCSDIINSKIEHLDANIYQLVKNSLFLFKNSKELKNQTLIEFNNLFVDEQLHNVELLSKEKYFLEEIQQISRKDMINVVSCTDGGLFHTLNNLNSVLFELAKFPKKKFQLIIANLGAFGNSFRHFFICDKKPNNVTIIYLNEIKDAHIVKLNRQSELNEKKLQKGSIHYLYRGKVTNIFYFRVRPEIIKRIKNKTQHINFALTLGVHFRNTDYKSDINMIIQKVKNMRVDRYKHIYLATDNKEAIPVFKKLFPNKVIQLSRIESVKNTNKSFHRFKGKVSENDKLFDCLVDIYALSKSRDNIYSVGSWKRFIPKIKKKGILF